jgi:hypothetical protein
MEYFLYKSKKSDRSEANLEILTLDIQMSEELRSNSRRDRLITNPLAAADRALASRSQPVQP